MTGNLQTGKKSTLPLNVKIFLKMKSQKLPGEVEFE